MPARKVVVPVVGAPAGAKRILIITPTPTHPTTAGNRIRIRNLIDALRGLGHQVCLLHAERERGDAEAMRRWLAPECFRSIAYRRPARREHPLRRFQRRLHQLISVDARHVWGIDDWYDDSIGDAAHAWHATTPFDVVLVEYVFLSRVLERFPANVCKLIDTHDRFSMRHRLYLERGLPPQFFSTTPAEEARGLRRADAILAIQDSEREFFSRLCQRPVLTVGHLFALADCNSPVDDGLTRLLFVGSENPINHDGLAHFLERIWPQLYAAHPQLRLQVAGTVSQHVSDRPGVERLGVVDDLEQVYRQADIVINPVLQGTGLNIKSIEALAAGRPLVSTASGARGLEDAVGRGVITVDTPEQFVLMLQMLIESPAERRRLGAAAREFASDWNQRTFAELKQLLA